jgi:hypothetical protein
VSNTFVTMICLLTFKFVATSSSIWDSFTTMIVNCYFIFNEAKIWDNLTFVSVNDSI